MKAAILTIVITVVLCIVAAIAFTKITEKNAAQMGVSHGTTQS